MQYNSTTYNAGEYNITAHDLNLSDILTETDELSKMPGIIRTDSQASVDALSDGVSLAAFLDAVTIRHQATYGNPYNSFSYNEATYNAVYDDDEVLLQIGKVLEDTTTLTDAIGPFVSEKVLLETITGSDVITSFDSVKSLLDFVFMSELFNIQFTNKALNETLRLADWLSIERNPQVNNWGD